MKTAIQRVRRNEAPLIDIQAIKKVYAMGETTVHALRGVSLAVYGGEYVAIVGSSGSGKSTLMNMIGLLDRPSEGSYCLRGTEVSRMNKAQLANLRNREIGFIFQRFHLLPRTSAQRQVELPLFYGGVGARQAAQRALVALQQVGLGERVHHLPEELSGGQQQRAQVGAQKTAAVLQLDQARGCRNTPMSCTSSNRRAGQAPVADSPMKFTSKETFIPATMVVRKSAARR